MKIDQETTPPKFNSLPLKSDRNPIEKKQSDSWFFKDRTYELCCAAKSGHPQLQCSLIQFQYHWIETVEEQFLGNLFEQRQEFDFDHNFREGFHTAG